MLVGTAERREPTNQLHLHMETLTGENYFIKYAVMGLSIHISLTILVILEYVYRECMSHSLLVRLLPSVSSQNKTAALIPLC